VGAFEGFFNSSYYGRLTVFDWLGTSAGVVVLLLTLMALVMFYLAEIGEAYFGEPRKAISWRPQSRLKLSATAALLAVCGLVLVLGQPTPQAKWARLQDGLAKSLENREVYVHPGEVAELKKNRTLMVRILDVRPEADFNLFHLGGAQRLDLAEIARPATLKGLLTAPDNTVFFVVSNGEQAATQAWRWLKASGVTNLYIIEGGINKWLEVFSPEPCLLASADKKRSGPGEQLQYDFRYAVGARSRAAHPDSVRSQPWLACPEGGQATPGTFAGSHDTKAPAALAYVKKVKLQRKVAVKGGCG
jgi:rhodanese-related sulfurtransferase